MAGFSVNYAAGKLVFQDGYVIPNPAVMFGMEATVDLWDRELTGSDVETISGTVLYKRAEKAKTADIPIVVSQRASSAGAAMSDPARCLKENWALLSSIADRTVSSGTQSVTYTPWIGATPVVLTALVLPPARGSMILGAGCRGVITMILQDGAVSDDGP